ncbi:tachylectin-related carbohydrate-binding protein [Kutzneria sp. 744]|uniref:tachylectin-related carbohydrate-binding protein n=1 Tax=Kutzneria sp. (strain 744) TaxID=345341 RepID=UPI0012F9CA65|nr:tachylectin-related carbohydrate-binding protein [Kutzneria sp. 744]
MPRRLSVVAAVAAAMVTVTIAPALAVSGGTGSYGFAAKLTADGRACSGALVAPAWVITAASCFPENADGGSPAKDTTVVVGRSDLSTTNGVVAHVSTLVPDAGHTVMLAKLDKAATDIAPVTLTSAAPVAGTTVRLAGFGRTATEWLPNLLHTNTFTVGTVDAAQLVLQSPDSDACKGDAGAPAFQEVDGKSVLVGVTTSSLQHGCVGVEQPQQGTTEVRADTLAAWIGQQTAPQQISCTPATVWSQRDDGLLWKYVHNGPGDGSISWVTPTASVGSGWLGHLLAGPDGVVYDIHKNTGTADPNPDGTLKRWVWTGTKWTGGGKVGSSWQRYFTPEYVNRITVDSQGRIFAIDTTGALRMYAWNNTTGTFDNPGGEVLGTGWAQYNSITAAGDGVLYARNPAGNLYRYQYSVATRTWLQRAELVGSGWQKFSEIFSPGGDVLYGRFFPTTSNAKLLWFRRDDRTDTWIEATGKVVGSGWNTQLHVAADPSACAPSN